MISSHILHFFLIIVTRYVIKVQEDRSYSEFCLVSGEEASIWSLDPETGSTERLYQVDRSVAVEGLPLGQEDTDPDDCGDWETSGIIDVTSLFEPDDCSTLLLANAQSHSVRWPNDPDVQADLVQGGQIFFLCKE